MPNAEQRKTYEDIIKLYDFAEAMIDAIEAHPTPNPELRLKLIEPVIEQIEKSAETLAEAYITLIETGEKPNEADKEKVVHAIRQMYVAINVYKQDIQKMKFN